MVSEEDKRFANFLHTRGVITARQAEEALSQKTRLHDDLSAILIRNGFADTKEVCLGLADYLNVPFIDLNDYSFDPAVIDLLSSELARRHKVFPVFRIENTLTITMANPGDVQVIDIIHRETGYEIEPSVSPESEILRAIEANYNAGRDIIDTFDEVIEHAERQQPKKQKKTSLQKLKEMSAATPAVRLVDLIIAQAVTDRASDIHIEPEQARVRVRYRIDGILHEALAPPKNLQAAMISRIKILSELDIAETRVPQDGRFQVNIHDRDIDLRVSTLPTVYGENVVMRILDKGSLMLDLTDLGMSAVALSSLKDILGNSYGIVLVSGPTGSGKTTTLYSALNALNTPEKKIVTVEDPVEYRMDGIRQCQVNVKAGFTFGAGLRSILRQDPDIIMVGEIRDFETAKIAVEAALTGHLVLSTIHTNDAPGCLTRLTEMGIEPFLSASATVGVVAQRLVKKICNDCKEEVAGRPALLEKLGLPMKETAFCRGNGCRHCKDTGYRGRSGIYEILVLNEPVRNLVLEHASSTAIRQQALQDGLISLRQDAVRNALDGVTSLEEVFRVTNPD